MAAAHGAGQTPMSAHVAPSAAYDINLQQNIEGDCACFLSPKLGSDQFTDPQNKSKRSRAGVESIIMDEVPV